jgi:phosphohistidine phosphatase
MELYVIRHAIAEDAAHGQDDAERELTDEGRKKLKQVVRGLRRLDIGFDRLLFSPWARARQTADLVAPLCEAPAIATDLLCQPPRAELLALIAETGTTTAVVGHEPWLGELIGWLAFGDARHGDGLLLKKASVSWLEGTAVPGGMTLRAVLPTRILRELA